MERIRYITNLDKITSIPSDERELLKKVTSRYQFRINNYYLDLIDWNDPDDPIRKLVIPNKEELEEYGKWDSSDESTNYTVPGCQHKYESTALLLVSNVCGAYCRYCFRKRLFQDDSEEVVLDLEQAFDYIRSQPKINNVLLTGGDPFMLSNVRLHGILRRLREIEHVKIIRIGSKIPAFNPKRISQDSELLDILKEHTGVYGRIYVMTHYNHPRELTESSLECIRRLHESGVILTNQTPVLKGINDNPEVLAELLNKMSWAGITPYYFFINRPVAGNSDFVLPLNQVYSIVEQAKSKISGLGKRVRLVMSHSSGKIELLSIQGNTAYLKYHQSRNGMDGTLMILPCPDYAAWFDDLPGNEQYWKA